MHCIECIVDTDSPAIGAAPHKTSLYEDEISVLTVLLVPLNLNFYRS